MAAVSTLDWQTGKTLSECFEHIFTSGTASDVTFIVGRGMERISSHKLVLISRSPVFYAMLEGPMAEKGEITIPDISEETFRSFLRYLYTDTINLTEENVVAVLSAARKYCVDILVSRCEEFLKTTLSVDSVCVILEVAHTLEMETLKNDCLGWIADSPTAILRSAAFADLCPICVTSITECEDIYADESDVYKAVIMWAEAECKRQNLEVTPDNSRKVLGDILYTVRFPVMENTFLYKDVCHDSILPAEDVIQIINYQHHKEKVSGSKFNYNERIANSPTHQLWRLEGITYSHTQVDAGMDSVSFSASDIIRLHGFGSYYSYGDNIVSVVIYENDQVVYKAEKISRVASKSDNIGEILLTDRERIFIKPGNVYTITQETHYGRQKQTDNYGHRRGQVICTQPLQFKHTTIIFHDRYKNLGNPNRHNGQQLPYLLLK